MKFIFKFLALVVTLNLVRYIVAGPIEQFTILPKLFGIMSENPTIFNNEFTTFDWVSSFFYNFMMWFIVTVVFVLMHKNLQGNMIIKSLKVFGLMFLLFASISAIYMNHYAHAKTFYILNILDGVIAFTIVALANGLLYPRFFKKEL